MLAMMAEPNFYLYIRFWSWYGRGEDRGERRRPDMGSRLPERILPGNRGAQGGEVQRAEGRGGY